MEINVRSRPDRTSTYKFSGTFYAYENKVLRVLGGQAARVELTPENRPEFMVNDYMKKRSTMKGVWFVEDALNAAAIYIDVATSDKGKNHYIWQIAASSEEYALFVIGKMDGHNVKEMPSGRQIVPEEEESGSSEEEEEDDDDEDEDREEFSEGEVVKLNSDAFVYITEDRGDDHFVGINSLGDQIEFVYDDIATSGDYDDATDAILESFDLDSQHLDGSDYNIVRWEGRLAKISGVDASDWQLMVNDDWVDIGPGEGQINSGSVSHDDVYAMEQDVYILVKNDDDDVEARIRGRVEGLNVEEQKYIVSPYEEDVEIGEEFLEDN